MNIYLPIAELSANIYYLLALGGIAGLVAGLFGIGGGFILTPILIFIGVPPAVSVATSTNMMVASSFSGFLSHFKRKRVDIKMGNYLVSGGLVGAFLGVYFFQRLQRVGQIDLMITLLYVSLLGSIGILMAREARQIFLARRRGQPHAAVVPLTLPRWVMNLPWQIEFPRSNVTHSALLPLFFGFLLGLLVGLLGVGGGFIMIPIMVYVLRMPVSVTIGTSLFQIIFLTAFATVLHAITTHALDLMLAGVLLIGSAFGAQFGVKLSHRMPTYLLRGLLALLLLFVAARLAYGLFITPPEIFTTVITLP